jgi:hypothetical protein
LSFFVFLVTWVFCSCAALLRSGLAPLIPSSSASLFSGLAHCVRWSLGHLWWIKL